jgi:hypothetical protein
MGADFAYIGSAFIATEEARAVEGYKQMITQSNSDDIVYSNFYTGIHGNYLKGSIRNAGMDPDNLPAQRPQQDELRQRRRFQQCQGLEMLKFYYSLAPNPMKVALFLEEAGLPYEPIPVDTRKGEQHLPAFTALNPNAKVPVIVDGATTVFDSSAILLYLAEQDGPVPARRRKTAARCCRG